MGVGGLPYFNTHKKLPKLNIFRINKTCFFLTSCNPEELEELNQEY
jgi:hypothetical protein